MTSSSNPSNVVPVLTLTSIAQAAVLVTAILLSSLPQTTRAAATDIAAYPLATTSAVHAKPNLMFILDDSGSMDSDYMPDDMTSTVNINGTNYSVYGFKSSHCNGVAYDPDITYKPPTKSDGSSYPNVSFSAAPSDGFDSASTKTDLKNKVYYKYTKASNKQPDMGWKYTTTGVVDNDFYKECKSVIGSSLGTSAFTTVTMTSASAEAQNYANWYSYYRKRYLLMRSAMGRAIAKLGPSYRVGFSTISDTSATDGTNDFRDVKDFDDTQKANFYSSLYTVKPSSYTPLRAALAKAGRYYANKAPGQTYDPMQYSCQRNYSLLSTDGYWNTNDESSTYGPFQLASNTKVGNQDAEETRPQKDSSQTVITTVTTATATGYRDQKSAQQTSTQVWQRTKTVIASTAGGSAGGVSCAATSKKPATYLKTVSTQTATETKKRYTVDPQQATYTRTTSVTTTDGVITAGPTSSTATGTWSLKTGASQQTVDPTDTGVPADGDFGSTANVYSCSSTAGSGSGTWGTPTIKTSWTAWSSATPYTYTPSSNPTPEDSAFTVTSVVPSKSYTGGASDSLADVAEYYWKTDIRNSAYNNCTSSSSGGSRDVCNDTVPTSDSDKNNSQHMNTFTIGLGVPGTLNYDKDYLSQIANKSGDYYDLSTGAKNWPNPGNGLEAVNIDDLWHAAVNGRGQYYSALNASDLSSAIAGVITKIESTPGAAAAAATSTLELVSGDNNQLFSASYTTQYWTGDLRSYAIDGQANIAADYTWSAQAKLDALVNKDFTERKIYFKGASSLTLFTYSNLGALGYYFDSLCNKDINPDAAGNQAPDQCATLSTDDWPIANSGTNLVNYLRGDRSNEGNIFRPREHVLGDVINGAPVYVGKPPFDYADAGYADFKSTQTSRKPVVYVAANDGMLHAFDANKTDGGNEMWAFIPTAALPNLYKLADTNYGNRHQYYVDGAPVMGDVKIGNDWKTIVVGGMNKGGSSYYALDITNPESPAILWEFTDPNMGLTYGNPVITKRVVNGVNQWVVVVSSGYNNTSGDGKGHLFVLDAATGERLLDLPTTEGSSSTPSGLSKINAWIDSVTDNTAKRFYGGDMQGNVWRFEVDVENRTGQTPKTPSVMKLAKLQINATTPQPISTKPVLAQLSNQAVVMIGTGRYLGESDITDTTKQSIYGIRDPLGATGWGDVRADSTNFTQQTITLNDVQNPSQATSAKITSNAVDWSKGGWWVDLPQSRERVAINMGLQLGTLAIGTAVPNGDACSSGGSSWRYYLNISTGSSIESSDAGVRWSPDTLIVGISWVKDADGNVQTIFQDSKGKLKTEIPPTPPGAGGGSAHRTSWRELID